MQNSFDLNTRSNAARLYNCSQGPFGREGVPAVCSQTGEDGGGGGEGEDEGEGGEGGDEDVGEGGEDDFEGGGWGGEVDSIAFSLHE